LAPQDLTVFNEEQTFKMDEVSAIIFVNNTVSDSIDIQQHYVGLMCFYKERLYMSIRKISDLNEPVFNIALSVDES